MERAMSVEEKIRRAEEIYQRRKQGEARPIAKVAVNNKKDIKLLKKMIIQIIICIVIYLCIYVIQNNQYIFSEDFINKANEILSYDTNFVEIYETIKNQITNMLGQKDENAGMGGAEEEKGNVVDETESKEDEEDLVTENTLSEEQNLSQTEIDIQNIKRCRKK